MMETQHAACLLRRNNNSNKRPPCAFVVNASKIVTMMLLHLFVASTHGFLLHQTTTPTTTAQQHEHHYHRHQVAQKTALYGEKDGPWWSEFMEVSDGAVSNKGAADPFERMRQRPPRTTDPNARAVNFGPDFTGDPTPPTVSNNNNSYREESDTAYRAAVTRSNNVPNGNDDNDIPASFRAEEQDSSKWSSFMTVSDGPDPVPDPVQRRYQEDLEKQREQERQQFEQEWKQQFPNQPVPPPPPSSASKKNKENNNKNQQQQQQQQGQFQPGPFANNKNNPQQQQYPQNPYAQQPYMGQYPYMNNMDPYGQQQQQFGQPQQNNYWDPYGQQQNSFVPPPGPFQQFPFPPGPFAPQSGTNENDNDRARSVVQQRMQAEMTKFEQEQMQKGSSSSSSMASDRSSPNGLWSPGTESTTPPPPETSESSGWSQYMSVSDGPEPTEYYPKSKSGPPREQQYFEPPPLEEEFDEEPIVMARSPDRPQSLWEGQTPPPSHGGNKYANNYSSNSNNNYNNQDPWLAEQTQQQQQQYWQAQQQQQWQQAMQQRALEEERRAAHMSIDSSPPAWEPPHSKARERQKQADRMAQFKAERARQEETLKELEKARAIARYRVLRTRLELERRVQAEEAARARAMAKIEVDERARRRASRDNAEELARREAEEKAIREADKKIRQERERLRAEELTKAEAAAREWEAAVARARAKILAEEIVKRERAKNAEEEKKGNDSEDEAKVKRSATKKKESIPRKRKLDRPSVRDDWKAKKSEVFNGARELYEEDFERPKKVETAEDQDEDDLDDSGDDDLESFEYEDDEDDLDDSEEDVESFEDDFEASSVAEEKQHRALLEAHLANEEAEKAASSAKKSTESKPAPVAKRKSQPSTPKGASERKSGSQSVVKFFDAPLVASSTQKKPTSPSKKDQPAAPTIPEPLSATDKQGPSNNEAKPDEESHFSQKEYFANRIEESRKRALLASIQAVIESKPDVAERITQLIDSVEKEAKTANDNSNVPSFESKQHFKNRIEESRKRAFETSQKSKSASSTKKEDPPVPVDLMKSDPPKSTNKPAASVAESTRASDTEPSAKPTPQKRRTPDANRVYASGMTESRRLSLLASIRAAKKPSEARLTSTRQPAVGKVKGSTDESGSKPAKSPVGKDDPASSPASSFENLKMISGQKTFLQAVGSQKNGKASAADDQVAKAKNGKSDDSSKATAKNGTKGVVKNGKEQAPKKT